jgi:hypothetical protein
MKFLIVLVIVLAVLILIGWLGLQVKPRPFSPYPKNGAEFKTIPLPEGLPAPVERFYKTVYGNEIPVIETAVIKGRAEISPFGVKLPARFLFVHNAGKDYRHYIEATWFGVPFMKVNESYVDGDSHFELPMGTYANDPSITQGAVLGLWAESSWFPSIFLTDERVHWEPVDAQTAALFVPFGEQEESFIVRFDPESGLIDLMEAMRCRDAGPEMHKILWITKSLPGPTIAGTPLSAIGSATWLDQGKPWATFTLEEVEYNVDVSEYIRQRGP